MNGNLVREAYFDVNGRPMMGPEGYAAWTATYDLSGNRIEVAYFGLRGEHVKSVDEYAGWRPQYDAFGRRMRVVYFGVTGALVQARSGVAGWTSSYDEAGNEIERQFFGVDGQPVAHKSGYADRALRYDRRGEVIEYEYLGPDGKPALNLLVFVRPGGRVRAPDTHARCSGQTLGDELFRPERRPGGAPGGLGARSQTLRCPRPGRDDRVFRHVGSQPAHAWRLLRQEGAYRPVRPGRRAHLPR